MNKTNYNSARRFRASQVWGTQSPMVNLKFEKDGKTDSTRTGVSNQQQIIDQWVDNGWKLIKKWA